MSHTKEPWTFDSYGRVKSDGCSEFLGVKVDGFSLSGEKEAQENSRRIVACVNACQLIPTEWLEKNGAYAIPTPSVRDAIKERDTYRDLCVELVKALTNHIDQTRPIWESVDVIVKAESILGEKNGTSN